MRYRKCSGIRAFIRCVFFILLLINICHINTSTSASSAESLEDAQKSNLREVVGNMIGVKTGGVERRDGRWSTMDMESKFTGRSRSVPRYISRLYERYLRGDIVHDADTVRSINAQLGSHSSD